MDTISRYSFSTKAQSSLLNDELFHEPTFHHFTKVSNIQKSAKFHELPFCNFKFAGESIGYFEVKFMIIKKFIEFE